jgi:cold-inducible RNA-binding protein
VKNIFVGNLSFNATEGAVRTMFEEFGTVDRVNIVTDRDTGSARGFGFVEMRNDGEGEKAIAALNGRDLDGRALGPKRIVAAVDSAEMAVASGRIAGERKDKETCQGPTNARPRVREIRRKRIGPVLCLFILITGGLPPLRCVTFKGYTGSSSVCK